MQAQESAWHLAFGKHPITATVIITMLRSMERWRKNGGRGGGGVGHRATHMGTWVPAEVALSRKDVASMNIVT